MQDRGFADRITDLQLSFLTLFVIMGGNYLIMPRGVVVLAGRDGWLALLLAGAVITLAAGSVVRLQLRFPGQTAVSYNRVLLGPVLGRILSLWLLAHFTLAGSYQVRLLLDSLKLYLLPHTPLEVTLAALLFTSAYAVRHGLNILARLSEVFFPLVVGFLLVIFLLLQVTADYRNLLPVAAQGIKPLALAALSGATLYQGFGHLVFTTAFLHRPQQAVGAVWRGLALVTGLYAFTYAVAVAVLGPDLLAHLLYPPLDLTRALDFPALLFERVEVLMLVVWMLAACLAFSLAFYLVSLGATQLLHLEKHDPVVFLLIPVFYFLARLPEDLAAQEALNRLVRVSFVLLTVTYAVILPVTARLRGRGGSGG
ncbi:MAG: endospore germination permease [Clostridia bacterium]|nr:spore germination protein [Clostridia bacterium]MDH7573925.1 endospore germination permease [Clostridia bacterium]